jgi:hypothetical protein
LGLGGLEAGREGTGNKNQSRKIFEKIKEILQKRRRISPLFVQVFLKENFFQKKI